MSSTYTERVSRLEAELAQAAEEIENRHGGVDYQGRLAALRRQLAKEQALANKFERMRRAAEARTIREAAQSLVEVLLEDDDPEDLQDIAYDFIENELGRFDWVKNWWTLRQQGLAESRMQAYLEQYAIDADAATVTAYIDRMVLTNPGTWQ
jgi:hypothetical protein